MRALALAFEAGCGSLKLAHAIDEPDTVFHDRVEQGLPFLLGCRARITMMPFRGYCNLIAPGRGPENLVTAREHFDWNHRGVYVTAMHPFEAIRMHEFWWLEQYVRGFELTPMISFARRTTRNHMRIRGDENRIEAGKENLRMHVLALARSDLDDRHVSHAMSVESDDAPKATRHERAIDILQ